MNILLELLAQTQFDRAQTGFKLGMTIAGIGIIIAGVGILLAKSKDPEKPTSSVVKWIGFAIAAAAGCSLIGYAWLIF